jgi:hypothetical protein
MAVLASVTERASRQSTLQTDESRGLVERRSSEFIVAPGYAGPQYEDRASGRVIVLTNTLANEKGSTWGTAGLLLNESATVVELSNVTGILLDRTGKEIVSVEAALLLPTMRPGEPVPFTVSSTISSEEVASVTWKISYARGLREDRIKAMSVERTPETRRTLDFSTYWTRPYGEHDRLYGYPQNDTAEGPYPYVVFGSIHNYGALPIEDASMVAAWLDNAGRVIHVDRLLFLPPSDSIKVESTTDLSADGAIDFLYRNDDPDIAPRLAGARMILWSAARD